MYAQLSRSLTVTEALQKNMYSQPPALIAPPPATTLQLHTFIANTSMRKPSLGASPFTERKCLVGILDWRKQSLAALLPLSCTGFHTKHNHSAHLSE